MELFGYVFAIIIWLALGFIIGWFTHRHMVHLKIEAIMQRLEKGMMDNIIEVRIERQGDMIYVYRADNNEFMVQGTSDVEVGKQLASRFPGKSFVAPRDQIEKIGISNVPL
jgi:hypothetical protein